MKHAAEPHVAGSLSVFEKSCGYCGARFRVLAMRGPDALQVADYACPECGRRYRTEAVGEPQVRLLIPRADGKDDSYQETMF
jgi:hypothetical protein